MNKIGDGPENDSQGRGSRNRRPRDEARQNGVESGKRSGGPSEKKPESSRGAGAAVEIRNIGAAVVQAGETDATHHAADTDPTPAIGATRIINTPTTLAQQQHDGRIV